jgi:hypothetical protein
MKRLRFLGLLAIAACAADEAAPSAGPVEVTVQQRTSTEPASGVTVVFHDASGAVLSTSVTDAAGKARGDIPSGGQITVARPDDLLTIAGAEPGAMYLVPGIPEGRQLPLGQATITTPGALTGAPAGATYHLSVGCSTQSFAAAAGSVEISVFPACPAKNGTVHVVARVLDDEGALLAFSTVAATAAAGDWTATLPAWTSADGLTVTVTGGPAGTESVATELAFVLDGHVYLGATASTPGTSGTFAFPVDNAAVDAFRVTISASFANGYATTTTIAAPTATQTVALGGLLPRLTAVDVSGGVRAELSFGGGSFADSDGGIATFGWEETSTWRVIVPPGTASPITLPALPDQLAALRPSEDQDAPLLSFWESTGIDAYPAFVQAALAGTLSAPPAAGSLTVRETHFGE